MRWETLEVGSKLRAILNLLTLKLTVITDTAKALADIIDTERSVRLEQIIVVLIALEIVIAGYQIFMH
jgi:uncharacterized Rmd1/YagE family protein